VLMQDGDRIRIEIAGIGAIENPVRVVGLGQAGTGTAVPCPWRAYEETTAGRRPRTLTSTGRKPPYFVTFVPTRHQRQVVALIRHHLSNRCEVPLTRG
jgi:hypothetical protein